jgi:hypothetical protein
MHAPFRAFIASRRSTTNLHRAISSYSQIGSLYNL